jgi:hypothetical protein
MTLSFQAEEVSPFVESEQKASATPRPGYKKGWNDHDGATSRGRPSLGSRLAMARGLGLYQVVEIVRPPVLTHQVRITRAAVIIDCACSKIIVHDDEQCDRL